MPRDCFRFLTGDVNWVDYGGKFWRKVGAGRYHIIELVNWVDACGEHEAAEVGSTYNVCLSEVDVLAASDEQKTSAARSWGWTLEDVREQQTGEAWGMTSPMENPDLMWAEILHSYGARAPLWQENGNNYQKLMRAARLESRDLDDPKTHEAAMNRPVNRLGSTAREFMQNDTASAMVRGVREGSEQAKLIAKMYGVPDKTIEATEVAGPCSAKFLAAGICLGDVPSDDPIAFQAGYLVALSGAGLDSPRNELADAYIEGYKLGIDVKGGHTPKPAFHVR